MPTATLTRETETGRTLLAPSIINQLPGWLMTIPFMFFACHGAFSFQSDGQAVGGFLPGAVEQRNPGFVGYVVIPGIAYGIVLWQMKSQWKRIVTYAGHFRLLTFLAVMTIVSALWSQNPFRSVQFGFFYLLGTLFAYYLIIRFEPAEIMALVSRAGVILCVLSVILAIAFPKFGLSSDLRSPGSWRGIFIDKTTAAKEIIFMLSPTLATWGSRSMTRQLLLIALPLLIIIKAHAVTGFIVLVLYAGFLGCLRFGRRLGPKLSLAFIVCASIATLGLAIWAFQYLPELLQSMGRDPTLTGRTTVWAALIVSILKHPILGYGFYSFWQGLVGESGNVITATNWSFGYAHNGTLEIFLQLGIVGVILFYATMTQAVRHAWYCFQNDQSGIYDWYLSLIALTILYNLDEVSVLLPNELASILYIVACCGLAQWAKRIKNDKVLYRAGLV
jgi:O-antigen ligase